MHTGKFCSITIKMFLSLRVSNFFLLATLAIHNSCAIYLEEQGISAFFWPEYDDTDFVLQFKVQPWWDQFSKTVLLAKGTNIPRVTLDCKQNLSTCLNWTVPGDIKAQIEPQTQVDIAKLVIYLTKTSDTKTIYGAPQEVIKPSCTEADDEVCCDTKAYSLTRSETTVDVYIPWYRKINGTNYQNGIQPNNLKQWGPQVELETGTYTNTVMWPNYFSNKAGTSTEQHFQGSIEFLKENAGGWSADNLTAITSHYVLLSKAAGVQFVIPNAVLQEQPRPLEYTSWKSCRMNNCSAPLGACVPPQSLPTPFASHRNRSLATLIEEGGNAVSIRNPRTCRMISPIIEENVPLYDQNFAVEAYHSAQSVSCTYDGISAVVSLLLRRFVVENSNMSPPPLPSPSARVPPPSPRQPASPSTPEGTPAVKPKGPNISLRIRFVDYTSSLDFATKKEADFVSRLLQTAREATSSAPLIKVLQTAQVAKRMMRRQLKVQAWVSVQVVISYWEAADQVAAEAFVSKITTSPQTVLPYSVFGNYTLEQASVFNCPIPCGLHGSPLPRTNYDSTVGCTCQCDAGWETDWNQYFGDFQYCNKVTSAPVVGGTSPGISEGE